MTNTAATRDGRRTAAAARRREREKEIIAATRELFDQAGVRDAQIEDIARAVGINRAIVYRHFSGKEEIFALTLVLYLDELRELLVAAGQSPGSLTERLTAVVTTFVQYGDAHPAFVDTASTLMRQSGPDLLHEISESALFRLGRSMGSCLATLTAILDEGNASGEFMVESPALLANTMYASGLGALQLARVGILVSESTPGVPSVSEVSADQVRDYLVAATLAMTKADATRR
ncbi:MAG: TetR/AcrR family transcriptional regulator [Nocardioides sp.]